MPYFFTSIYATLLTRQYNTTTSKKTHEKDYLTSSIAENSTTITKYFFTLLKICLNLPINFKKKKEKRKVMF